MNRDRPVYLTEFYWNNDHDCLFYTLSNGWCGLIKWISAGYTGKYTFPFPFYNPPLCFTSFRSTRSSASYDRELCCFNLTRTSAEFNNFAVPTYGGQGGCLILLDMRG